MAEQTSEGKEADAMETLTQYFLENNVAADVKEAFNQIRKEKPIKPLLFGKPMKPWARFYIIGPNEKCIHVEGAKDSNGAKLSQWDKSKQENFMWYICPVLGDEGYYNIVNVSNGKVLHNHGAGNKNGAKCTTWKLCPNANLRVKFEKVTDANYVYKTYWYIIFKDSGKCVHNHGGGNKNGALITQWEKVAAQNLYWRFEEA